MSEPRLERFDAGLDAVLDDERAAVAPAEPLDRVWSRIAGVAPPAAPKGDPPRPRAAGGWGASKVTAVAAAAFLAGGGAGLVLHAVLQEPATVRVVYVDRPIPAAPPAPAEQGPHEPTSLPLAPQVAPSALRGTRAAASTLQAERALLDEARAALGAGDAGRALALLANHEHRFAQAQLVEEREALTVVALVNAGRYGEARAQADRFRAKRPLSLFLPTINAALASIP